MILLRISFGSLSVREVLFLLLIILLGFLVLRPSMSGLLQSATSVITKNYRFFFYYKVWQVLLQSATGITKWDDYYKARQNRPTLCIDYISWRENLVADIFHETPYEH